MFARVTTATAQPDKIDEVIRTERDSVLPAAKAQKGFKGLWVLSDKSTGKGMVITFWNTEADMTACESSGYYRQQVAKVMPLCAGTFTAERYEVSVQG